MELKDLNNNNGWEKLKKFILKDYEGENNGQDCELAEMIVDDFVEELNCCQKDTEIIDIIDVVIGKYDGSYTCSTYESAKIIAENIFEFNAICNEMIENGANDFEITETEENLVKVLWYILDNLLEEYENVQDLLNDFEKNIDNI